MINKDGKLVTKHDVAMNGRRNACKMMSFPPEIETGDGAGFDFKLSNKVFNRYECLNIFNFCLDKSIFKFVCYTFSGFLH